MNYRKLRKQRQIFIWLFTFLFALANESAWALVTVSGKIREAESGESIPGVAVMVKGTMRGAAANVEGFFSIPDLEPGNITLMFNALGYEPKEMKLTLVDGQSQNLAIELGSKPLQFQAVEIETERDKEPEFVARVAQLKVTTKELVKLPQLAEPDLFRSLQIMPGVLPSSDFSADLNIWGGSSDQNLILLNGINVYKPTHLGGIFSIFNMDAIKDVKLIKGGFGAKYGGRLSAVVDIADREGNRNEFQGKVGVSLLSSSVTLEGPLPHGSWLVAGRRTYVDWATKLLADGGVIDDGFPYYFYDYNMKLTRDFANGDRISPSIYAGDDILKLTSATGDRLRFDWGNNTFSLPFVHIFSPKLFSRTTLAGSFFHAKQRFETANAWFEWNNEISDFTGSSEYSWFPNARNAMDFGAEVKAIDASLNAFGDTYDFYRNDYNGAIYSGYVSDDFRATENWTLTPGVRYEYNGFQDRNELCPRFAIRRDLSDYSRLSAAWGLYTQYLQTITFGQDAATIFDSYVPLDQDLLPNRGQQYALTFEHDSLGAFKIKANAYYKRFQNVIEYDFLVEDDGDLDVEDNFRSGNGYAYGLDFMLQGNSGRYDYMLGYGLGRSRRAFDAFDHGESYPTLFDRLHNTNLFVSRKVRNRGQLEVRANYGTGQPRTRVIGVYSPGFNLPPHFFVQGKKNGHRLDDYYRIDIAYRLRYEYKHWTFSPYFEIINLTGKKNVLAEQADLKSNPVVFKDVGQLPFLPTIGFTAEF